jgi:hypothetical protein
MATHKTCTEIIDLGSSTYTINHDVYGLYIHPIYLTQTIGYGSHDLGMLPPERVVRLYKYPFDKFPIEIYRDTNNPQPVKVDKYLIFENIQELPPNSQVNNNSQVNEL